MSKFAIPTIADEDLDMSISAELGEETRVFYAYDRVRGVGKVECDTPSSGTLIQDRTYRAPTNPAVGRDMQVICDGPVLATAQIIIVLGVTFAVGAAVNITGNTAANPSVVTTAAPHGLTSGQSVVISGNTGSVPSINGTQVVTVLTATTFSIPVNVTTLGTGGSMQQVAAGQATATMNPPETAQDQSFNLPPGLAVDLIPDMAHAQCQIRSIDTIVSVAGMNANMSFEIISIPDFSSFTEIACITDKNLEIKVPKSVAIACRYNSSRWVKKGRDEVPKLDLKAKWNSYGDGIGRISGQSVTMMFQTWKNDTILTERLIVGGYRPTAKKTGGDGDAEVMGDATGIYETYAAFV